MKANDFETYYSYRTTSCYVINCHSTIFFLQIYYRLSMTHGGYDELF